MRKFYQIGIPFIISLFVSLTIFSQNNFFTDAGANRSLPATGFRAIIPQQYRASIMDFQAMKNFLWALPTDRSLANRNQAPILELPMPDGRVARFRVWESSIQAPALQARFPNIRTFAGQGIDDRYATIRFDLTETGFHAQVLTVNGTFYIDPYAVGNKDQYISYFRKDLARLAPFHCEVQDNVARNTENVIEADCRGTQLRTFRLAVACTGEYAQAPGISAGTNPAVLHSAIVTTVNRVVGVYEVEIAVRLELVPNNSAVEFLDPVTDPFNGNTNANTLINESQTVIDANVGPANYDIGHTFSTGGGGLAQLSSVCGSSKARGITGSSFPTGDAYDIDYVAHEMGHQFGGNHSMAGCGLSPTSTKYEVGSGTTIQAYAGICGTQDIQPHSDPFFHAISFDEISNFLSSGGGGTCGVVTATGNTLPVIDPLPNNGVSIPVNTPFTLTGSATDANGDALTYCWEQWDFSGTASWNAGASAPAGNTVPLFKSRIPKTTGSRTFPDMAVILAGYPINPPSQMDGLKGETLSPVPRAIKFKLTVRDNRAGGGGVVSLGSSGCQASAIFQVNVVGAVPFLVLSPNGGESFPGGSTQTITWDVAGTNVAPVSVTNVRILMSTDGGLTYPTVLSASTANDGSEPIALPAVTTSTARIKIEAIGNIFFDISNDNFSLTPPPSGFDFTSPAPATSSCPAGASMQIVLGTTSTGGFTNPISLSATGNPVGTTVGFSTNPVTPGNNVTVTLNGTNTLAAGTYIVTVTGTATGAVTRTRDLTFTITPGSGPAITAQPANQTICVGSNTSFSITSATATGIQWQVSTDGGSNFNNITNGGVYSGATTSTLTITGAPITLNSYRYRAIASVLCGSTTSTAAILTVNAAPAISAQPQSITLCAGSNHTFTTTASGAGLTYQWETSVNGCAGPWSPIPSATSSSYTLNGITAGMNNTGYRVIVSGTCTPAATSNCALLNVVTSVAVSSQPADITVCAGDNASFTVVGSGTGVIYQWEVSTDGGSNYTTITNGGVYSGATTGTLTITGVTFGFNGYKYRAQLSNSTCTTPGVSNAATLTVNTLPAVTTHPQNATICVGAGNTFTAAGTGTGIGYQWQLSTDNGNSWNDIGGATTSSYSVSNATALMNGYRYRVVIAGTCPPAANSNAAILTVISPVTIAGAGQPTNKQVCSGSNTTFTVTGTSVEPITYRWQVSTDGGTNFTDINNGGVYSGATTQTLTITGATTAMNSYKYRVQLSNNTCTSPTASASANLTVRQLPTVTLASSANSLLPGQTATLTATPSASTGGTLSTSWLYNGDPIANTGNIRQVNIEQVGNYQVNIQEVFAPDVNNPNAITCANQSAVVAINAEVSSRLFIFPSPNDGQFTVSYYNGGAGNSNRTVTIYDSHGAKVYHAKFSVTGAYTLLPINIRTVSRGLYFVVIGDANGRKIAKGNVVVH
jgi:hypothetical protein